MNASFAKPKSVLATAAIAAVMCLGLSSCWLDGNGFSLTTKTNTVAVGNVYYVFYSRTATNQVSDLLQYTINNGDGGKTLDTMKEFAQPSKLIKNKLVEAAANTPIGSGVMNDFLSFFDKNNETGDFNGAAGATHNNTNCLVMHRNFNPLNDNKNWTARDATDQHCHIGKGFV